MKLAVTLPHPSRPPTAVFPISWYTTTKEPPSKGPTPRPFPPRPDEVTTQSSVRHAIEPDTSAAGKEHNAVESLKSDVVCCRHLPDEQSTSNPSSPPY